jgi:hypothetical protein
MEPRRSQRSDSQYNTPSLPLVQFPPSAHVLHPGYTNRMDMRTNAQDIDMNGRRTGRRDLDDGDLDDKDLLPIYEPKGGPPRYPDMGSGGANARPVTMDDLTRPIPSHDIRRDQEILPNPPSYIYTGDPHVSNVPHSDVSSGSVPCNQGFHSVSVRIPPFLPSSPMTDFIPSDDPSDYYFI